MENTPPPGAPGVAPTQDSRAKISGLELAPAIAPRCRPSTRRFGAAPRSRVGSTRLHQLGCNGSEAFRAFCDQADRALFQCGAIASHASNILTGSRAQFHRDETTRQAIHAETRLCLPAVFGNSTRSGPPAMGAAKRNGPSVRHGHRRSVIAVHDRFVRRQTAR
jgi:hypothetical protein